MITKTNLALDRYKSPVKNIGYAPERAVLVDDDPVYQSIFTAVGKALGVNIKSYKSLAEMASVAHLNNYEFVIVDYHLESWKGTEIAEYVDIFFPKLPVFLISADEKVGTKSGFPSSVKKFFSKTSDPYEILKVAVATVEQIRFYDGLRSQ